MAVLNWGVILAKSGVSCYHDLLGRGVLLAFRGKRPEIPLRILQCTEKLPTTKNSVPKCQYCEEIMLRPSTIQSLKIEEEYLRIQKNFYTLCKMILKS